MSKRTVEDWRRAVYRSPLITDKTRVYLLLLADHMNANRMVSVPRARIAKMLGRTERRIDDRTKEAKDAGLLDTVVRGQKHVTAVYIGLFPETRSAPKSSWLSPAETALSAPKVSGPMDADIQRSEIDLSAPPVERATSRRPTQRSPRSVAPTAAPSGADADAPRPYRFEEDDDEKRDSESRAFAVPSRSGAVKRAMTQKLWQRYDDLIANANSDTQIEVAAGFAALLHASGLRSPLGYLKRVLRDHEHVDAREVGQVLAYVLRAAAERYGARVDERFGEDWCYCTSCWSWRFACNCPVAEVWPAVETAFAGVDTDVMNELAMAVDVVVCAVGPARVLVELPPPRVVQAIERDGRAEEAARFLTVRLRMIAEQPAGWDAPAGPCEETAKVDK